MRPFVMNGLVWIPVRVEPDDPRLVDRTGMPRLATTDPSAGRVYISARLKGADLHRVMVHEAAHCALWSYGMLESLHRIVPEESWVQVEEWVCNLVADLGAEILEAASTALSMRVIA